MPRQLAPSALEAEGICSGLVLDPSRLDLEEIGNALADQTGYERRWLIDPQTGEIVFWTADTGINSQTPVDIDELDLVCIDPLPSWVWYQTWPTSPKPSANMPGAGCWVLSRAREPSASKTSSTMSIRTCCRRSMRSAIPAPSAVLSNG